MCGACGVLGGGPDWVDRVGNPEGVSHGPNLTRTAERQRRIALANLLLHEIKLHLTEINGTLVVRGPTGRQEIIDSLSHVWMAADRSATQRLDVLDPDLVAGLESC